MSQVKLVPIKATYTAEMAKRLSHISSGASIDFVHIYPMKDTVFVNPPPFAVVHIDMFDGEVYKKLVSGDEVVIEFREVEDGND